MPAGEILCCIVFLDMPISGEQRCVREQQFVAGANIVIGFAPMGDEIRLCCKYEVPIQKYGVLAIFIEKYGFSEINSTKVRAGLNRYSI